MLINFKNVQLIFLCCILLILPSCVTVTRRIEAAANQENTYPDVPSLDPSLVKNPPTVDLSQYRSVEDRPGAIKNAAIAMAASGGGYRAANMTAGVLMGLENIYVPRYHTNLLQAIDYYSTVSGGGFAVGTYLSRLNNYQQQNIDIKNPPPFSFNELMQTMLQSSSFTGDKGNVLANDLLAYMFFGSTRGSDLEDSFDHNILYSPQGTFTLGDMFIPKKNTRAKVRLPLWVPNATIYQNASIFPFSPDVLARYRVYQYQHHYKIYTLPDVLTDPYYAMAMPVSVGMAASASIPFAVPPMTLQSLACKGPCYLQLVDGGLSDNLGIYTALDLLAQDKNKTKILIIVDAFKDDAQPFSKNPVPPGDFTMLWRILNMDTDSNRQKMRAHFASFAHDILCSRGADNVLVAYLDLADYPQARAVGTRFDITHNEQTMLIQVGQNLVAENPEIQHDLLHLLQGDRSIGQCRPIEKQRRTFFFELGRHLL